MKKFWKYLAISAIAVGAMPMVSCSDDDAVDPYTLNYCYVYQPYSTYAQLEYKANGEFLVDISNPLAVMPVRLTKPASRDLNITVGIDESLVAEYNEANGTDYKFLTGCSIANSPLKIKAGDYISTKTIQQTFVDPDAEEGENMITEDIVVNDSITVSFGDMSGFMTGETDYILPIVITNADGATISKSSRIFLTFSSTYRANQVSVNYLSKVAIDVEADGWQSAYTNLTVDDVFTGQWLADDDIVISTTIDNSLIAAYNEANNTTYAPLPGTSLKSSTATIAKGQQSAPLQFTLGNYTGVENGAEYLIPVKVSLQSGVGAELDDDVVYVLISNIPDEIYPTGSNSDNTSGFNKLTDISKWNGTVELVDYGTTFSLNSMFNNTGYGYVDSYESDIVNIDLGEVIEISMFQIKFYSGSYAAMSIDNVETSIDGTTWKSWGSVELGKSTYWNLEFSKPNSFRYIRWINGPQTSSWYEVSYRSLSFYTK